MIEILDAEIEYRLYHGLLLFDQLEHSVLSDTEKSVYIVEADHIHAKNTYRDHHEQLYLVLVPEVGDEQIIEDEVELRALVLTPLQEDLDFGAHLILEDVLRLLQEYMAIANVLEHQRGDDLQITVQADLFRVHLAQKEEVFADYLLIDVPAAAAEDIFY